MQPAGGAGSFLLKQAYCLQPTLLEGGLINGSMQIHAGTVHAGCILSLYIASLNKLPGAVEIHATHDDSPLVIE